jgi:hypothetical protein
MTFEVWAIRGDGVKVLVRTSVERVDLRAFKELLIMRSTEFDEKSRLFQYSVKSK